MNELLSNEELNKLDEMARLIYEVKNYYLFEPDWEKCIGEPKYGAKLEVLWKDDVAHVKEMNKEGCRMDEWEMADEGILIRLPVSFDRPEENGVVWVNETPAEKCTGDPYWISLVRLLTFEEVYKVRFKLY